MVWKFLSKDISAGRKKVEIRSVCLPDEFGNLKRRRVTTCWNPSRPVFSKTPAVGCLVKDKEGKIGIMVSGKNGANIKIGGFVNSIPYIFVAVNSISKIPRSALLKEVEVELFAEGNLIFAKEK
ncbi:MAG: hypothetical protein NC913_04650 [Candidatus Omnitrophica bacterium]|nr:hypothetical protein [Candidatus Omnitrophota bacterium]